MTGFMLKKDRNLKKKKISMTFRIEIIEKRVEYGLNEKDRIGVHPE